MNIKAAAAAAVLVATLTSAVPSAGAAATDARVAVSWHPQMAPMSGPVEGASAHLVRTGNGISYSLHATNLVAGHSYTLWQVVVNNPAACDPRPCTAPDILGNPDADGQVSYAAGHVTGGRGQATLAGSQRVGAIPEGWLDDRGLVDPMGAEVHLVLNDHGPALAELMPEMIHTYRGGCSDSSPFPPIFPPKAIADGQVGPNTCRLTQVAVFA
ncbi:MAG: hypothetical protein ACRD03_14755 [Acidimicrobiales bacterium]